MTELIELIKKYDVNTGLDDDKFRWFRVVDDLSDFTGYRTEKQDGKTIHVFEVDYDASTIEYVLDIDGENIKLTRLAKDNKSGEYVVGVSFEQETTGGGYISIYNS